MEQINKQIELKKKFQRTEKKERKKGRKKERKKEKRLGQAKKSHFRERSEKQITEQNRLCVETTVLLTFLSGFKLLSKQKNNEKERKEH